ncbi:FAD-dependent oxidoreductase, partial [Candidatus Woesearchaeota archaeon]|nr:FAD-dependent oxidoreductase [Candidatus Woesearchaeota archaeon]
MKKRVVIVGCGYGGIDVAVEVKRKLKDSVSVTAINEGPYHVLYGNVPKILSSSLPVQKVNLPLKDFFEKNGVRFVQDSVTAIDNAKKQVLFKKRLPVPYDFLVIDVGSEPNFRNIKGAEEFTFPLKNVEDAIDVHEHIENELIASRNWTGVKQTSARTIVLCGGGVTGVEAVAELAGLRSTLCKKIGIKPSLVHIILLESSDRLVSNFSEAVSKKVEDELKKNDIKIIKKARIRQIKNHVVDIHSQMLQASTIIWTSGLKANRMLKKTCLKLDKGYLLVNNSLQTSDPHVFGAGDCISFKSTSKTSSGAGRLPKMLTYAVAEEKIIIKNIINSINNKNLKIFRPKKNYPIVITLGKNKGILVYGKKVFSGIWTY